MVSAVTDLRFRPKPGRFLQGVFAWMFLRISSQFPNRTILEKEDSNVQTIR